MASTDDSIGHVFSELFPDEQIRDVQKQGLMNSWAMSFSDAIAHLPR
ncbi:MAG: hypothetical protein M3O33_02345 [Cyanobacteriota bacterium]|nr:hypothetical protein [Cyanobacteriota bacterium]